MQKLIMRDLSVHIDIRTPLKQYFIKHYWPNDTEPNEIEKACEHFPDEIQIAHSLLVYDYAENVIAEMKERKFNRFEVSALKIIAEEEEEEKTCRHNLEEEKIPKNSPPLEFARLSSTSNQYVQSITKPANMQTPSVPIPYRTAPKGSKDKIRKNVQNDNESEKKCCMLL